MFFKAFYYFIINLLYIQNNILIALFYFLKGGILLGYWNTRGLRGSGLEEFINATNDVYRQRGLAIIQKIPTPITPVEINKNDRTIKLAYFEQKSTVDYIGVVQGIAVCFDAKETSRKSLPIQNIHAHQIEFMSNFQKQQGISFLVVYFKECDEYYFLPFEILELYWNDSKGGGRKSIPYSSFEKELMIYNQNGCILNYLEPLNTYLMRKQTAMK